MVYWFIWLDRKNFIFENRPPSATSVAYKLLVLHNPWTAIHPRTMGKITKHKTPIIGEDSHKLVRWSITIKWYVEWRKEE
jgi:hypothetical protein